jgi:predicted lactoylglutathione lyase
MIKLMFLTLPVADLKKSVGFFKAGRHCKVLARQEPIEH